MSTTTKAVLSVGDAIALGDLITAIGAKKKVEWMDESGDIRKGELRSLVRNRNDFGFIMWGQDVRDAFIWITSNGFETTCSVVHAMKMLPEGGMIFSD